jgi:NADP-dependent 3-hydroxy acid dehydrogenase YdfG
VSLKDGVPEIKEKDKVTTSIKSTPDVVEFKGKRILVTGGTKGAGKAIADRFLQGNGTVIITARSAPEKTT